MPMPTKRSIAGTPKCRAKREATAAAVTSPPATTSAASRFTTLSTSPRQRRNHELLVDLQRGAAAQLGVGLLDAREQGLVAVVAVGHHRQRVAGLDPVGGAVAPG